jgi:hypothetical protein
MESHIPIYSPLVSYNTSGTLIEFKWINPDFAVERLRLTLMPSQQEYIVHHSTTTFKIQVGFEPIPWKASVQYFLNETWHPLCEFHPVRRGFLR